MNTELKARDIHLIEISFMSGESEPLHPQLLALKLENRVYPLDIGVFAFSVRGRHDARKGTYWVDENSLVSSRKNLIVALLDDYYVSGTTHASINTDIKNFEYGVNWCDANDCSDVFCSPEAARLSYLKFTNHLNQEILKENGASPLSCQARQRALKKALQLQFPDCHEHIVAGISPIKHIREGLEPPEKESVSVYVDICLNISLTLSRFLVAAAPFPLRFETKDYHTYIFPVNDTYVTPYAGVPSAFRAYDFEAGRIRDATELELEGLVWKDARESAQNARDTLRDANSDEYHHSKMRLATLAMQAYACLLNMVVGANSGEVIQFLYDDALELVKSPLKKELSAVKLRAKGLEVNYTVGRGPGMKILKEYLIFREWLLNGRQCEFLFFRPVVGERAGLKSWGSEQLNSDFSTRFFRRIQGVFLPQSAKNIPPVRVRKYKSLTLHLLKNSPLLVSTMLNHSVDTNLQSYSGVGEADQKLEFQRYWAAVRSAALRASAADPTSGVSIAAGHCGKLNSPERDIPLVSIEPDCSSPYGCLFCVNYQVHSDETDVHKLVSFQYVIDGIRRNAPVFTFSEEAFKDLSVRIEAVLDAISKRSSVAYQLVNSIKKKVFDLGILTPFWEQRLQRYEKMGIYF